MNNFQRYLPFPEKETRAERCERLLGGQLRRHVRRASELPLFDYATATRQARTITAGRPRLGRVTRAQPMPNTDMTTIASNPGPTQ